MRNDFLKNRKKIWIIGVVFDESQEKPNSFILIQTGDIETPISENDKILIFCENTLIKYLYEKHDLFFLKEELYDELDIVLNVPVLVKKIKNAKTDVNCLILNSLNLLFDLTKHLYKSKRKNPNVRVFYSFVDHLTFEKEFDKSYLKKNGVDKNSLLDSVYWHLGLLIANSRIVYPLE